VIEVCYIVGFGNYDPKKGYFVVQILYLCFCPFSQLHERLQTVIQFGIKEKNCAK